MKDTIQNRSGFTLIELLIVVAIIAILAAIVAPNFLEAQTRSKVSRVKADQRSMATALEAYRIDYNQYPEGTDNPAKYDQKIADLLAAHPGGDLSPGYYGFRTRDSDPSIVAGIHFFTLTTPIAFMTSILNDPFVADASTFFTYCYRPAKNTKDAFIITSFGPDRDLFEDRGGQLGVGSSSLSPFGTLADATHNPARLGDINEREVIHFFEREAATLTDVDAFGGFRDSIGDLTYDPTNGTVSDGDLWRTNN
jgi:prepilin-type N-terminal cleavage/methylation domain-containing protein